MAKRFMYVSIGVLCLVAAYQVGVERARADWEPSAGGVIVGGDEGFVWTTAGTCWQLSGDGSWQRVAERDLPVTPQEVKLISAYGSAEVRLITVADEGWIFNGTWFRAEPFPAGPVSLGSESWGKVKARHR